MLDQFSFHLPKELIAQKPARPRDSSKLLHIKGLELEHLVFRDIAKFFRKGDVLVLNNTKVLANKLYGKKKSGARADIIIEAREGELYRCRVNANRPSIGTELVFPGLKARIEKHEGDEFWLSFDKDPKNVLERHGCLPQPNYIGNLEKDEHYQTVYSHQPGSLAAPTSGLHFTKTLLEKIENKGVMITYVTLHISFGTFRPIEGPVEKHRMDEEEYEIPEKTADAVNNRKGRLFVCGTTSFKALESAADEKGKIIPMKARSSLFIYPGHRFKVHPDFMITNFHFPKSTLLLFVSAYFGREAVMHAYDEAVKEKYRFYSLGDACLFESW